MTIRCDVILDPDEVNGFLKEHGYGIESGPVEVTDDELGHVERNALTAILLGRNRGGVATVLLCHEVQTAPSQTGLKVIPTSLALLEHVVGTMRDAIGEDARVGLDGRIEEEPPEAV